MNIHKSKVKKNGGSMYVFTFADKQEATRLFEHIRTVIFRRADKKNKARYYELVGTLEGRTCKDDADPFGYYSVLYSGEIENWLCMLFELADATGEELSPF